MSVLTQPRQVQLEQPATVILLPSKHEALELISAAGAEKYLDKMAEIDAQIAKLNAVIQAQTANLRAEIDKLAERRERFEEQVKDWVKSAQTSVKGEYLQAVYSKGRTTWDSKALDGYAVTHEEILQFKKTGAPSVAIKAVTVAKTVS